MKDSIQKYLKRELNHELVGLDLSKISEEIKDEIFAGFQNTTSLLYVDDSVLRDNEIKMQMATQMYCALLNGTRVVEGIDEAKVIESFCEASEQIFNRFNK